MRGKDDMDTRREQALQGAVDEGIEVSGAASTEVVVSWRGSVVAVRHFAHLDTYAGGRPMTTRGETVVAGACMLAGGVVLGPALGGLVRRATKRQVVPAGRTFTLGEDPKSDLPVMAELLAGRSSFELVTAGGRGSTVHVLEGMEAELILPSGERQPLCCPVGMPTLDVDLPEGGRIALRLGDLDLSVSLVPPGRLPVAPVDADWTAAGYTALSLLAHATFLFLVYFVPPDPSSLVVDGIDENDRFARYLIAPPEVQQDRVEDWTVAPTTEREGGDGRRHADAEGQMGDPRAAKTNRRFGIEGPRDNPDPHMARERAKEYAAEAGILAVLRSAAPTSPFGRETALGSDPESALGALMGNEIGQSFGYDGLGLHGTGRGGGGTGEGTIGLGHLGTIGRGAGGGRGQGYGRGEGTLHGRPSGDGPSIRTGTATVGGALSQETIRRYIRRNLAQIRYCYEHELARRPDLAGRVQIQFIINGSGSVTSSRVAGSTMGSPEVEGCVARAVERIAFPAPENGGVVIVTYPFMFQPAE